MPVCVQGLLQPATLDHSFAFPGGAYCLAMARTVVRRPLPDHGLADMSERGTLAAPGLVPSACQFTPGQGVNLSLRRRFGVLRLTVFDEHPAHTTAARKACHARRRGALSTLDTVVGSCGGIVGLDHLGTPLSGGSKMWVVLSREAARAPASESFLPPAQILMQDRKNRGFTLSEAPTPQRGPGHGAALPAPRTGPRAPGRPCRAASPGARLRRGPGASAAAPRHTDARPRPDRRRQQAGRRHTDERRSGTADAAVGRGRCRDPARRSRSAPHPLAPARAGSRVPLRAGCPSERPRAAAGPHAVRRQAGRGCGPVQRAGQADPDPDPGPAPALADLPGPLRRAPRRHAAPAPSPRPCARSSAGRVPPCCARSPPIPAPAPPSSRPARIAPASAGEHASVLRSAGLTAAVRHRSAMLHAPTTAGIGLLEAVAADAFSRRPPPPPAPRPARRGPAG